MDQEQKKEILKQFYSSTGYNIKDCLSALESVNYSMLDAKYLLAKKYAVKWSNSSSGDEYVVGILQQNDGYFGYCQLSSSSEILIRSTEFFDLVKVTFESIDQEESPINSIDILMQKNNFKDKYDYLLTYFRSTISFKYAEKRRIKKNEIFGEYIHNIFHKDDSHEITTAKSACLLTLQYTKDLSDLSINQLSQLANEIACTAVASKMGDIFYPHQMDKQLIDEFTNSKRVELQSLGKPKNVIEKILIGSQKKFIEEYVVCYYPLINSSKFEWLEGDDISIEEAISQTESYLDTKITITFFKVFHGN